MSELYIRFMAPVIPLTASQRMQASAPLVEGYTDSPRRGTE